MPASSPNARDGLFRGVARRDFLQLAGAGALAALLSDSGALADTDPNPPLQSLIPADKHLSPEWIKSLFERGEPTVYRGSDLRLIGMPVSGLTTGQLYLGGDGSLWHWDIFNFIPHTAEEHYAHPMEPQAPLAQGFSLLVHDGGNALSRPLNARVFSDVSFCGQYPIGTVNYRDKECPIAVTLEAFSPFVPLSFDDSSIPATVMRFTLKNTSAGRVDAELSGYLENAVGLYSGNGRLTRTNQIIRNGNKLLLLDCTATPLKKPAVQSSRAPIVFEDFEGSDYGKWKGEGTAFGDKPAPGDGPEHLRGFVGKSLANSFAASQSDAPQGKLTSQPFTIERSFINFLIAGGNHRGKTCINLIVDGHVVNTATGRNSHDLEWCSWNVRALEGQTATLEIVDHDSSAWGHIQVDQIEFADVPRVPLGPMEQERDFGTMCLALLEPTDADRSIAAGTLDAARGVVTALQGEEHAENDRPIGALTRPLSLEPGASQQVTFIIAWNFPNLQLDRIKGGCGRYYATRFATAAAAAEYLAENFDRLVSTTYLWRDTFYDSSLPFWFLDRTHLNISVLATSTAYRFANGRFYGWEGVGSCEGTCTHVWSYEQAMGRLFPELNKLLRERAEFNPDIGFRPDGMIDYREEFHAGQAIDGQAGTLLRAYRDHQMSVDNTFLLKNYPAIRKAMEYLINQDGLDGAEDGILRGAQHNTLDTAWYGPCAWLSGLYLASLRAVEEMAIDAGDQQFATKCRTVFQTGQQNFVRLLFNGEYFINIPDPKRPDAINSGSGCEIDQALGQSWAFQVGLGEVLPQKETRSSLRSLWVYNFAPDVGPYRNVNKPGRWYAMPGETGLLMCTFPKPDWNYDKAKGRGPGWAAGYFNECMNGFEHLAAAHMIWQGMLLEGLAVERALHDRYHASKRNPWNEVECGDHYARSMASYGLFVAACGYEYHGPKGYLAFAPRLNPQDFKAAFTTAEGWGSFSQQSTGGTMTAQLDLKWGQLRLQRLKLALPEKFNCSTATVLLNGKPLDAKHAVADGQVQLDFEATTIQTNQKLEVKLA
jgi:uncharacterized protein (DUF608 family)